MFVRRAILFGVLILGGCVIGVQGKLAVAKGPTPRTIAVSGKQTYTQYCAFSAYYNAGLQPAKYSLNAPRAMP